MGYLKTQTESFQNEIFKKTKKKMVKQHIYLSVYLGWEFYENKTEFFKNTQANFADVQKCSVSAVWDYFIMLSLTQAFLSFHYLEI